MEHFQRVDSFSLEQELGVTRYAREEGRRDKPARSDTTLDDHQRAIIGAINEKLNGARSYGEERLKEISVKLGSIDLRATTNALQNLKIDTEMQVERTRGRFHDRLMGLRQREREMLRELNFFQRINNLHRIAEYPESEILHWSIVATLVVVESIANSYFFAGGSDLGLLGGALQALLISCVNIGVALLAGVYLSRNLNHVNQTRKIFAGIGLATYVAFVMFFNLATAHYRMELAIDPLNAIFKALSSLVRDPFGIKDFDAVILLFVGIIFSIGAGIKAYLADDRYPGYGNVDRRFREADYEYQQAKQELREAVNTLVDQARTILHNYAEAARNANREFGALVAQGETLISEYFRHTAELRSSCHTLLNQYRTENQKIRSSPAPSYFQDYPPIDVDDRLPESDIDRHKKRLSTIGSELSEIEKQASDVMQQLKDVNADALKGCESFFKTIEEEVEERLSGSEANIGRPERN